MPQNRFNNGKVWISALLLLLSGCGAQDAIDESRCEPYPKERAEELITNSDTGQRKIKGEIVATAAVRSKDTFTGGQGQQVPIYVIAINVDRQIVVVLLGSDSPTGPGLYSSTDVLSERATSFPQNGRIGTNSTEGVAQARACVTKS
jgi:hypothetical protein